MGSDTKKVWQRQYASVWVYVTDGDVFGDMGFKPWSNGCGIGRSLKTKEQAVAFCLRFAKKRLTNRRHDLLSGVGDIDAALVKLNREATRGKSR